MPDDKTTIIIDTLKRLETKADTGEARHIDLLNKIGSVEARIVGLETQVAAMEKADQREVARQSEDRGGARAWIGTAGAWLLAIVSLLVTLTHRK